MTVIAAPLVAALVALALTPAVRAFALRSGTIDVPNDRSSHEVPTPRGGGIAILIGLAAGLLAVRPAIDDPLVFLLVGTAAIAIVGFVDDLRSLSVSVRLGIQIVVAIGVAAGGTLLIDLISPLGSLRVPLFALSVVLTAFWATGVTNAYNFMDGINGIASVQAVIAGAALAILLARHGDVSGAVVAMATAGAAAGFLPWNYPKARIFMGDVGSAALGFLLAMLAVRLSLFGGSLLEGALPFLPFLFDTSLTLARRIANREKWWTAHRTHLYQRLTQLGWSHASVTAVWGGLALLSAAGAILLRELTWTAGMVAVIALLLLHAALAFAILRRPIATAA
jgi:UDP-GlcNAc:undecaprenyl-phosphate/decaprenyl-phosphate GlcNAc-1-phosphate transferase